MLSSCRSRSPGPLPSLRSSAASSRSLTSNPVLCLAILHTPSELVSDANPGSQSHVRQVSDPGHDPPHSFEDRQHNIADCPHHRHPCLEDEQDPFGRSAATFDAVSSSHPILLAVIRVPGSPWSFASSAVLPVQKLSCNQGWLVSKRPDTGDKDPNTHQTHAGYIGSTDNK